MTNKSDTRFEITRKEIETQYKREYCIQKLNQKAIWRNQKLPYEHRPIVTIIDMVTCGTNIGECTVINCNGQSWKSNIDEWILIK